MEVTIFGLGQKAFKAISSLKQQHLNIIDQVIIGKDNDVQNDYAHDIENFCKENNIRYEFRNRANTENSKVLVAIGWRWLIKKNENQQLIVFHDSILPKYRGFNPLVTTLINGDEEIGVTALIGEKEFDRGDIIGVEKCRINYPIKIERAIDLISDCYATLLQLVFKKLLAGHFNATPQNETEATYSLWRDFEDYYINWNWPADKIKRMVDAVGCPYEGARTRAEEVEYLIQDVTVVEDVLIENRTVGKVLFKENDKPIIVCGSGLIRIDNMINTIDNSNDLPKKFRLRFK